MKRLLSSLHSENGIGVNYKVDNLLLQTVIFIVIILLSIMSGKAQSFSSVSVGIHPADGKAGGHCWADFNNDGYVDLFVNTAGLTNRGYLYLSNSGSSFTDGSTTNASPSTLFTANAGEEWRSVVAGDIDGDGDIDIIRTRASRISILKNGGAPNYVFTETSSITSGGNSFSPELGAFIDYDGDGDLDLIVDSDRDMLLYNNNGSGTFTIANSNGTQMGIPWNGATNPNGDYGAVCDYDNDGYVDIYARRNGINNNKQEADIFKNNGNSTFTYTNSSNLTASNTNKGGVAFADLDNDGDFDVIVTDDAGPTNANQMKILEQTGVGSGIFAVKTVTITGSLAALPNTGGTDGVTVGDVNNDGKMDFFVTDGIGTASYLFLNQGSWTFNVNNLGINVLLDGQSCEFVDYDNDGDLDLYVSVNGAANQMWRNTFANTSYLNVVPVIAIGTTGQIQTRPAIGATVVVKDCSGNIVSGIQQVSGGSGYGSQGAQRLHFGLPSGYNKYYRVEVSFVRPNGGSRKVVTLTVRPKDLENQTIYVSQSSSNLSIACADKDSDGVDNMDDDDADNDGVANYLEVANCTTQSILNFNAFANNTNPNSIVASNSYNMIFINCSNTSTTIYNNWVSSYYTAIPDKTIEIYQFPTTNAQKSTTTFTFARPINNLTFKLQDIDSANIPSTTTPQFVDSVVVKAWYKGVSIILTAANFSYNSTFLTYRNGALIGITNAPETTTDGQAIVTISGFIDKLTVDYYNNLITPGGGQGIGIGGFSYCDFMGQDTDGDGLANYLDSDSDNDGVPDVVEAYGVDVNGDGKIDNFVDADGDGFDDNAETNGTGGFGLQDFDGDGTPNYIDLDSDGDGIPDIIEAGGTDTNNDGKVDSFTDVNGNGLQDALEGASALIKTGTDTNNDGKTDSWPNKNIDLTGKPNLYDLDSDGDGLSDYEESGLRNTLEPAAIGNKTIAYAVGGSSNGWSLNVKGITTGTLTLTNTDAHGQPDYLDIDSDNDGITDNIEAMSTSAYLESTDTDTDADGLVDAYDGSTGTYGGTALTPYDHDGDGTPDYKDTDTDNDGVPDRNEGDRNYSAITQATINASADTDGDGLVDLFDTYNNLTATATNYYKNYSMSNMGSGGSYNGPTPSGSQIQLQKSDPLANRDWRNISILPLHLVSLQANYNTPMATIKWAVVGEFQTEHYLLERSIDGIIFQSIHQQVARNKGTDNYNYPDNLVNINAKVVYYRVRQVQKSGEQFVSNVVSVKLATTVEVKAYPNPFTSLVNVSFYSPNNQNVHININDAMGRIVATRFVTVQKGNNSVNFSSLQTLSPGVYVIQLKGDGFDESIKLIKL